jgi:hypothetical protein
MHPEWRQIFALQAPLALLFGSLSGLFLGRALGLHALTRARRADPELHAAR